MYVLTQRDISYKKYATGDHKQNDVIRGRLVFNIGQVFKSKI
jgi:hypothetical protein